MRQCDAVEERFVPPAFGDRSGMDPRVALRLPEDDEKTALNFRARGRFASGFWQDFPCGFIHALPPRLTIPPP